MSVESLWGDFEELEETQKTPKEEIEVETPKEDESEETPKEIGRAHV